MVIFQLIQKFQLRGAEMFAAQLSQHLESQGHQVFLIALFSGDGELPFSGEKIKLNRPVNKRWVDLKGWKVFSELVRKHQPDIVQCNAGDTLKFAVLSKKTFGWKSPLIFRNASMASLYITNPLTKAINGWLYKQVDYIISVSENSKKDINALFPVTQKKTAVVPVGIAIHLPQKADWLQSSSVKYHIIHVGGFTFEKNHERLLYIFREVLETMPESHLHLLGEGPKKEAIQLLAKTLGLTDNITFYGWVSNPIDYICKADVLLLPSIIEGLPGVILEAMSCKVPVVAYNVGGISEVVQDGLTGFLVEKNQEDIFAKTVVKVLTEDTNTVTQRAFDLVSSQYDNKYIAKQFEEIYSKLISSKQKK